MSERADYSWRLLLILGFLAAIAVLIAAVISVPVPEQTVSSGKPAPSKLKSRDIALTIYEYLVEHGDVPFDKRGPEYALYQLHDRIDAKEFQVFDTAGSEPPRWDHDTQRLVGGDVEYINEPLSDFGESIVFIVTPRDSEKWTFVGQLDCSVMMDTFAATPDQRILGSFRTLDGLYVVGRKLFNDVALTHVAADYSWAPTYESHRGLISATIAGRSLHYQIVGGRIQRCDIETPRGKIVEIFCTDSLGQVIGVTRSPPNWREILGPEVRH